MDFDAIPVVDLAALRSPKAEARERLVSCVHDACTRVRFFYIKNHGIDQALLSGMHDMARRFFSLQEEIKMKCHIGKSEKYHGFIPLLGEKSTGAAGTDDPADAAGQACFSEVFDIGYETAADSTKPPGAPLPADTFNLLGGNQWLSEDDCPGFRAHFLAYFAALLDLARELMRVFAQALGLDAAYFDGMLTHPGTLCRLVHYPPQPPQGPAMVGLPAHTDYECITILSQGDVPALQVRNNSGQWVRADPMPGTLVVNIGDCLAMWTNNRFKSTVHRVCNLTGEDRYTVPFFFGVDYDTVITPLETCLANGADGSERVQPIQAGEYVRKKMARAHRGEKANALHDGQ